MQTQHTQTQTSQVYGVISITCSSVEITMHPCPNYLRRHKILNTSKLALALFETFRCLHYHLSLRNFTSRALKFESPYAAPSSADRTSYCENAGKKRGTNLEHRASTRSSGARLAPRTECDHSLIGWDVWAIISRTRTAYTYCNGVLKIYFAMPSQQCIDDRNTS